MVANRITGRSGLNFPTWCLLALLVLFGVMLPATQVQSAIIQQPITIDGNMSDWKVPADITTNPGQASTDGENIDITTDLDYPVQGTGRDLKGFSFTYDATNLYMWVARYASTNNFTDWWFYIDTDNNGSMEATDKLLRVGWTGSNGKTTVQLFDYVPAATGSGSDSLVCPLLGPNSVADGWCTLASAGIADGYDMPGSQGTEYTLSSPDAKNQNGGSTAGASAGVEMETSISWGALGFVPAGPNSVGFHIATSNGANIPTQINDNMGGAGGGIGVIQFSDLEVIKTASVASVYVGSSFTYTVTVTNNGGSDATNVSLVDDLPTEAIYMSDIPSVGTYDPITGIWTIGDLANGVTATLNITVIAGPVAIDTVVTNTADTLLLDQADPDLTNNEASVDVTIRNAPDILVLKSAQTISDPVASADPKSIPGAIVLYTITITNQGLSAVDADTLDITDPIPANTELFVGDLGNLPAGSPVAFIDGATPSGLNLSFIGLGSTTDDIEFSTVSGLPPVPDADGYDEGVTELRLQPTGSFAASDGVNHPSFSIMFKVRIQ